jgi:hypothetical protein
MKQNDILPSIITPRSTLNSFERRPVKRINEFKRKDIDLHLPAFRSNLLMRPHSPKRSRSLWNSWQSPMHFIVIKSSRSSAYPNTLTFSKMSNASLISKMKNIGLKWLPCGTPEWHWIDSANSPPIWHDVSDLSDGTSSYTKATHQKKLTNWTSTVRENHPVESLGKVCVHAVNLPPIPVIENWTKLLTVERREYNLIITGSE